MKARGTTQRNPCARMHQSPPHPTATVPPAVSLYMKIAHIKFYVNILDIKLICDYSLFVNRDPFDNVRDQWGQQRPDLDPSGFEIFWRIFFLNKDLRRSAGRRLSRLELPNWAFDVLAILRRQGPPFQMSPRSHGKPSAVRAWRLRNNKLISIVGSSIG